MTMLTPPRLMRAADNLVRDHFAVGPGESVLITGDTLTEHVLLDAVAGSVVRAGAKPLVALAPPRPTLSINAIWSEDGDQSKVGRFLEAAGSLAAEQGWY